MSHRRARIIAASAHDFVQFGCGQCHGMDGSGGVPPYVPALDTLGSSLTAAQRSSIIEHGAGLSANPTHRSGAGSCPNGRSRSGGLHPRRPLGRGRSYTATRSHQSGTSSRGASAVREIWVRQLSRAKRPRRRSQPRVAGQDDPPTRAGADFRSEFNTPQKIKDVIVSGSVLGQAPSVSMPQWGGILTPRQLDALVAYLATLQ